MNKLRVRWATVAALSVAVGLAGCGGGSDSAPAPVAPPVPAPPPPAASNTLTTDVVITGFPHKIDIYKPVGATRAVVFLHGGLGEKEHFAFNLGINGVDGTPATGSVNWKWLTDNHVVAIFPQGQHISSAPLATTWTNRVMTSGQDDVAFLAALASYAKAQLGATKVHIVGHSNGAMMANRMWCESPTTFDAYVAFSGPASEFYLDSGPNCRPSTYKPYYGLIGSLDTTLQTATWTSPTWTLNPGFSIGPAFVDPVLVGEWAQYVDRAKRVCNQTPLLSEMTVSGSTQTWKKCGTTGSLQVQLEIGAEHDLGMPYPASNPVLINRAIAFIDREAS